MLLDWSNARIAPPSLDVANLVFADGPEVARIYLDERTPADRDRTRQLADSIRLIVRGAVGFAGHPDEPSQPRLLAFRDRSLQDVQQALDWLDSQS